MYAWNQEQAESYQSFLQAQGCPTALIDRDEIVQTPLSTYDLVLIGNDTEGMGTWSDEALRTIEDSNKPVIGLGEGGYDFFGKLGLTIGRPHGWHGDVNSIYVVEPNSLMFDAPYSVGIPEDGILQLYGRTGHVGIHLSVLPDSVIAFGGEPLSPSHYPLVAEQGHLLWGFTECPEQMTEAGKRLFLNAVILTANARLERETAQSL